MNSEPLRNSKIQAIFSWFDNNSLPPSSAANRLSNQSQVGSKTASQVASNNDAALAIAKQGLIPNQGMQTINWLRIVPFILIHLFPLLIFVVGFSWTALWFAVAFYVLRMFAITGFYHRYFSHRNFKTSRTIQFIFAFIGATSAQRGPLWWASHHREHHRHSDTTADPHSPEHKGFWWSHMFWFLADENLPTQTQRIKDFTKYRELQWLDRFDMFAPLILIIGLFLTGEILAVYAPSLDTNGLQLVVWGFFVSTLCLYHATYTINSLAHRFGKRRFETPDNSRNNFWLALITLGEGWHNNHHYFSGTARQGFYWWEIDITYYLLKIMNKLGLVWELKPLPERIKQQLSKDH
ncbi:acyl-CoA desaturase [Aliikangiella maris]|uniref:Acyl-CoA desaturase n=2 Tax=Aliikangiella maris TaxID=3162458 RepID=A0ABV2BSE4_9GAMM